MFPEKQTIMQYCSCKQKNRNTPILYVKRDQVIITQPFSNIYDVETLLNMLNGIPVLKLCRFTYSILDLICISAFIVYLFFFFSFGETSGIKAKCFNKQGKRCLVSLYQINREQNCLIKLHFSRIDIKS